MPPATDELVRRINTVEPATLEAAARALNAAAEQMSDHGSQVNGVVGATLPQWEGRAASAWQDHFAQPVANLRNAAPALRETAAALREIAAAAEQAKRVIASAQDSLADIYMNPLDLGARATAESLIDSAASSYHADEQRIRGTLWRIGDSAPYPLPGPPPILPLPPPPGWQTALFGPGPTYTWVLDQDGNAYGVDEDGNRVPAYRGGPELVEVHQMGGVGGLLRVIPRIGRRLPPNPTSRQVAAAFAGDIPSAI